MRYYNVDTKTALVNILSTHPAVRESRLPFLLRKIDKAMREADTSCAGAYPNVWGVVCNNPVIFKRCDDEEGFYDSSNGRIITRDGCRGLFKKGFVNKTYNFKLPKPVVSAMKRTIKAFSEWDLLSLSCQEINYFYACPKHN